MYTLCCLAQTRCQINSWLGMNDKQKPIRLKRIESVLTRESSSHNKFVQMKQSIYPEPFDYQCFWIMSNKCMHFEYRSEKILFYSKRYNEWQSVSEEFPNMRVITNFISEFFNGSKKISQSHSEPHFVRP